MNHEVSQSKLESGAVPPGPAVETLGTEPRCSSCWKITKYHENRVLRFVCFGLIISLLILIIGYNLRSSFPESSFTDEVVKAHSSSREDNVCLSKGCVIAAANVIDRLDTSVDPCDDFYSFACGNFVKKVVLPEDKSFVNSISTTSDILSLKLRMLIEEDLKDDDPSSTKLVKNLYKSCMNTGLIEANGLEPIKRILRELGGWPVVEGALWDEDKFSLTDLIFAVRKFAFAETPFFQFGVKRDYKNSSWRIIEIDQASLGMPSREYFMKGLHDEDIQSYLNYQVRLATLLGADPKSAKDELQKAVLFEIQVANFSLPEEFRRDSNFLYNKMAVRELAENVPEFPWLNFTNHLLPPNLDRVTEEESVIVTSPVYIAQLFELIKATPKRVLFNYLLRHVVMISAQYLSHEIRQAELQFSHKIFGFTKEAPRWKECMDKVSDELSYAVGSLYVRHFFNEDSKLEAEEMVTYIRRAIDKNLESIDWMDEKTRVRALEKAKAIKALIGYPKEILDEDILMDHYKNLTISDTDFFTNIGNLTLFRWNFALEHLRKKVVEADWKINGAAAVVNAFYSAPDNAILFPAGILQGVFFDANRPKYMNYGSIGLVIGHEIIHGFDDEGSQFNENGDLLNWWEEETKLKFLNRSKCIIEQYEDFYVPEVKLNLNGKRTQGENIADNGGIKEAYRAYNMWTEDANSEELSLPGLKYSPRQLFWVSAAHLWCSKLRNEHLKMSVLSKSHSPPKFRVNGPMKNLHEFSKDWNCSPNSKMNPTNKCTVW